MYDVTEHSCMCTAGDHTQDNPTLPSGTTDPLSEIESSDGMRTTYNCT